MCELTGKQAMKILSVLSNLIFNNNVFDMSKSNTPPLDIGNLLPMDRRRLNIQKTVISNFRYDLLNNISSETIYSNN